MDNTNEITSAYRNSRRNTSFLCGIGIAWSAAQFEIKNLSLGPLGEVNLESTSFAIVISILCVYSFTRCTIEYMMQSEFVRRWPLAQLDYCITMNLLRFTLIALAASAINRTGEMIFSIAVSTVALFLGFFVLVFILTLIIMPYRMFIRKLTGRISVASAAIESSGWSLLIVTLLYIVMIVLTGLSIVQPFKYLGIDHSEIGNTIFSFVCGFILFSFLLDRRFLNLVFAIEPIIIKKSYFDDQGQEVVTIEPNPNHPNYEENKKQNSTLVYTKVKK
ncbi:MAG: hypothetical protein H0V39_06200 [Nitrosomonas sp.]|nr:hypothetical protein [Nitrosomonas sp.]